MHYLCKWNAALCIALLAAMAGCGGGSDRLTVSAASSLRTVLPALIGDARLNVGGSGVLATQITEGAPVDVVALADIAIMNGLHAKGAIAKPVPIATNRLTIIVAPGNPAHIASPADLARPGVRLVLAQPAVPVGEYARQALSTLHLQRAFANVVSNEDAVAGVVAKVRLGEADAGIVYATDAAGDSTIASVAIPTGAQPSIVYAAAVVSASSHAAAARELVATLAGSNGQAALAAAGFGPPPT